MGIVRFALRFPHTFYVVAALILFLGVVASWKMPTDIFPEINIPVVTVIWSYTGLSTPEMEQSRRHQRADGVGCRHDLRNGKVKTDVRLEINLRNLTLPAGTAKIGAGDA
jgi:hypothetical protein